MTASSSLDGVQTSQRQSQKLFYILAVLFNLCAIAQILTVGLAYFSNSEWWNVHVWLVRGYAGLSIILLVWAYSIPFSPKVRRLAVSLPLLLVLQFLTIHVNFLLPLAVLHPLIGFALFSASTSLVHRVWRVINPSLSEE